MHPPSTPECDWTAEQEHSQLRCIDMTGTDEHQNSCSCSSTPTWGDDPIPQPDFGGQAGFGRGFMPPPA